MATSWMPSAVRRWVRWWRRDAALSPDRASQLQASLDFEAACPLLQLHEAAVHAARVPGDHGLALSAQYAAFRRQWHNAPLEKMVCFANDGITVQLSDLLQHVHDMDAGDTGAPLAMPALGAPLPPSTPASSAAGQRRRRREAVAPGHGDATRPAASAAFQPTIGPSSLTNPAATLQFHMKHQAAQDAADGAIAYRNALLQRAGFSLWLGPSQAPTPTCAAGLYLKGKVPPGTVIALYPGAAFNREMLMKAVDCGHLGNPAVPRLLLPRYDGCVIDVHAPSARPLAARNPYALAAHARHPPPSIAPNAIRLQYDFVEVSDGIEVSAEAPLPFPPHLRAYVPNSWGSDVTVGQQWYGSLEQRLMAKGMVLITTRAVWDEEVFVDHTLNPATPQPGWYTALHPHASERVWKRLTG